MHSYFRHAARQSSDYSCTNWMFVEPIKELSLFTTKAQYTLMSDHGWKAFPRHSVLIYYDSEYDIKELIIITSIRPIWIRVSYDLIRASHKRFDCIVYPAARRLFEQQFSIIVYYRVSSWKRTIRRRWGGCSVGAWLECTILLLFIVVIDTQLTRNPALLLIRFIY